MRSALQIRGVICGGEGVIFAKPPGSSGCHDQGNNEQGPEDLPIGRTARRSPIAVSMEFRLLKSGFPFADSVR